MGIIQWGIDPWGRNVALHAAWDLIWIALAAGVLGLALHAVWAHFHPETGGAPPLPPGAADCVPEEVERHSPAARLFHWIMAAAMLVLLATAFLPKVGLRFAWVDAHWMAGAVLILAIVFHIVHASVAMDFRSIWPGPSDLKELRGEPVRTGKYPLGNKLYHLALVVFGLCMAITGALMLAKVRTPFFTRDPYILGDAAWGVVYLLHGLAGIGLIALVIIHIYFALRPEKLPITRAMVTGRMRREYYLKHHDPAQWGCEEPARRA